MVRSGRGIGFEPQAPRDHIPGDVTHLPIMSVRVGPQPDEGHGGGHPQLHNDHPGSLMHLRMLEGSLFMPCIRLRPAGHVTGQQ